MPRLDGSEKKATTEAELKGKVINFSICSHLFILLLSIISNLILPDHKAGVFRFPVPKQNVTVADKAVEILFGGLARWDAQYYLHISHYGYSYENTLAFFPLFPYLTRILARCLEFVIGFMMNSLSTMLISAVTINFIFFVGAAAKLFELSCVILQDSKLAYISALFFCINPASIFFRAPYSESCFSFFAFSGMLFCVKYNNNVLSSFAFGLSTCVRSNGIVNFGFIAHKSVKETVKFMNSRKALIHQIYFACEQFFKFIIYSIIFFAPFVIFQCYVYFTFCLQNSTIPQFLKEFGYSKGFVMPGGGYAPSWCNYSLPISYSYIQSHYWNVGFLRYYELKQIPNFLLASPIIFLILSNSYLFMVENKMSLVSLGFNDIGLVLNSLHGRKVRPECFVFVSHALVLTVFCALFIHVQVTTRMIASSCPVLYWFVALRYKYSCSSVGDPIQSRLRVIKNSNKYTFIESHANINSFWKTVVITEKPSDLPSSILRLYFLSYSIIGTILFSNYYPWT